MEKFIKIYDLEERTALFAERVRDFCLKLPKNPANECIGGKDFKMKIKTCRREAKESAYG